ncbi:hypothetical protein [Burkholderia vietnamiensis]|jgi:hypothetical protein|uniref:hypothetical protein n=1 Tax=Burkholderia vietnamiensis TaxID=60552 RepID=UPI000F8095D0|nr:hypothetical protein [Burkholderia vietnamiensis]
MAEWTPLSPRDRLRFRSTFRITSWANFSLCAASAASSVEISSPHSNNEFARVIAQKVAIVATEHFDTEVKKDMLLAHGAPFKRAQVR